MATSGASYMARRRAEARAKGMCGQCLTRQAAPNRYRCTSCQHGETTKAQNRIAREQTGIDWCFDCLAAGFHRADCRVRRVA